MIPFKLSVRALILGQSGELSSWASSLISRALRSVREASTVLDPEEVHGVEAGDLSPLLLADRQLLEALARSSTQMIFIARCPCGGFDCRP
jgi:hypothetical protein